MKTLFAKIGAALAFVSTIITIYSWWVSTRTPPAEPANNTSAERGSPSPPGESRSDLARALDAARQNGSASDRDDAMTRIVHRAAAIKDFEFACKVAGEMAYVNHKDECFDYVVDSALNEANTIWANTAAEGITFPSTRQRARQKIADLESAISR